jgi:hypothetical protein
LNLGSTRENGREFEYKGPFDLMPERVAGSSSRGDWIWTEFEHVFWRYNSAPVASSWELFCARRSDVTEAD